MTFGFGIASALYRLVSDRRGAILVQFTLYAIPVLGLSGLALDGGRYFLLNSNLQDLADAAALAGAAKLDGSTGATSAATTAAQAMANNNPVRWYDTGGSKTITTLFYSSLNPDTPAGGTATDATAQYIKVTTASSQISPWFVSAVKVFTGSAVSNNSTSATAMAQYSTTTCGVISGYMCAADLNSAVAGQQFLSLSKASGGSGDWGIIDLPSWAADQTQLLSALTTNTCTPNATVHQHPGNGSSNAIINGINVLFDQPVTSGTTDEQTSAPNVIDGYKTTGCGNVSKTPTGFVQTDSNPATYDSSCNASPATGSCPLPHDRNIGTSNPGSGVTTADLQAYWKNHHGTSTLPTGVNTRYAAYQCELGVGSFAGVSGCSPTWSTDSFENHAPSCSAHTGDYTRRILHMAIYDGTCPSGNSGPNLSFSRYADFFVTEQATKVTGKPAIYTELIAVYSANANQNSILRRIVQLVR